MNKTKRKQIQKPYLNCSFFSFMIFHCSFLSNLLKQKQENKEKQFFRKLLHFPLIIEHIFWIVSRIYEFKNKKL